LTLAAELLQRHFQTLVADTAQWQTLIADDLVWELPYAPAIGHPARLSGREAVVRHVTWFVEAVENFHFFDLTGPVLARRRPFVTTIHDAAMLHGFDLIVSKELNLQKTRVNTCAQLCVNVRRCP